MSELSARFHSYDPAAGRRKKAPLIRDAMWQKYREDITYLHIFGLTQRQILEWLNNKGFHPNARQLWSRMNIWGLNRRNKTSSRVLNSIDPLIHKFSIRDTNDASPQLERATDSCPHLANSVKLLLAGKSRDSGFYIRCTDFNPRSGLWYGTYCDEVRSMPLRQQYNTIIRRCSEGCSPDYAVGLTASLTTRGNHQQKSFPGPGFCIYSMHGYNQHPFGTSLGGRLCRYHYAELVSLVQEWLTFPYGIDGHSLLWVFTMVHELAGSSVVLRDTFALEKETYEADTATHLTAARTCMDMINRKLVDKNQFRWFEAAYQDLVRQTHPYFNTRLVSSSFYFGQVIKGLLLQATGDGRESFFF